LTRVSHQSSRQTLKLEHSKYIAYWLSWIWSLCFTITPNPKRLHAHRVSQFYASDILWKQAQASNPDPKRCGI
jgi:hypothetical protein